MPSAKQRDKAADNERRAWDLRLQGWTQQQIAEELGLSQSTVCVALDRIEKKLAREFRDHAEEVKARQTEQLQMVFQAAWEQWRRSCEDAQKVKTVKGRVASNEAGYIPLPDLVTEMVEGQSGNPALLSQAMKALADIRTIWGMDAPKKSEVKLNPETMTDEEIDAILAAAAHPGDDSGAEEREGAAATGGAGETE
jgi:predicted transcriptional regulator